MRNSELKSGHIVVPGVRLACTSLPVHHDMIVRIPLVDKIVAPR